MPCNVNVSPSYPLGGPVQVTCSGGVGTLSTAYGSVTTNCRPSRFRGRINGSTWVVVTVSPMFSGGSYIASWTLRNIPGATCDNVNDTLELEVEVTDGNGVVAWVPGNPVNFNAYCFMMPSPMRFEAANMFNLKLPALTVPTLLWGILESELAEEQVVKLKRVQSTGQRSAAPTAEWRSIGTAQGLWTLTLGVDKRAELRLKLKGKIGGTTYTFEFLWGCGQFSPFGGGLFGPVGDNPITQVLSVTGVAGAGGMLRRAAAKAKGRAKPKAKAKRPAKKRSARR